MRADQLPSPGTLASSQTLRHTVTHAISRAEINRDRGNESTADDLLAFFEDCAAKVNQIIIDAGGAQ